VIVASNCGPYCGFPLFLHVLGAMVLFGGVASVALLSIVATRASEHRPILQRLSLATLLLLVWPGWIAMRAGGQWVLNDEGLDKQTPGWADAGFLVADVGLVLLLVTTLLAWLASRRPRLVPWVAGLASLYVVALGIAWFAMSAKPGS
jgi:hypothetical protein